jgi:hypothetical protein
LDVEAKNTGANIEYQYAREYTVKSTGNGGTYREYGDYLSTEEAKGQTNT